MRRTLIAVFLAALAGLAFAQADPVVAKVGTTEITKSRFDLQFGLFVRDALSNQGQPYTPEAAQQFDSFKEQFLGRLAREEAIGQAARAAGLAATDADIDAAMAEVVSQFEKPEDFAKALEEAGIPSQAAYRALVSEALTYNAYLDSLASKVKVSGPAVTLLYTLSKRQYAVPQRYCAAHILVPTAKEANDIIARLGKGEKFADLAKKFSQDPGSKEDGGELGCEPRGTYVAPFELGMVALKPGQASRTPVRTEFGFHVILLNKVEPASFRPLDSVRESLENSIRDAVLDKLLASVAEKARIELFPDNLK